MIKAILKKIFPARVLKDTFLILNKFRIKTFDRFFFPERIFQKKDYLIYEETNPFLGNNVFTKDFTEDIQRKLELWVDPAWCQEQYLLHYKGSAYIDPDYGWAITGRHELIFPSLGFSQGSLC